MVRFRGLLILITLTYQHAVTSSKNTYVLRSEQIVNQFNEYIKFLSEPKPLKCTTNIPNSVLSQNHTQWVISKRCDRNDTWTAFIYKGNYDNQDRLFGPGKLTITSHEDAALSNNTNLNSCLRLPMKFRKKISIVSIVGTFVNGTLHGSSKIVFSDSTFVIARFENGVPKGLKRVFNSEKMLLSASMVYGSSEIGFSWRLIGGNYTYLINYKHDSESYKSGNIDLYKSLVFNSSDFSIVGGEYMEYVDLFYDPYAPESIEFDLESEDCIKYPTWEKSKILSGSVYSIRLNSLIENLSPPNYTLLRDSSPERLLAFSKYIYSEPDIFLERSRLFSPPKSNHFKTSFIKEIRKKDDKAYTAMIMGGKANISHTEGLLDENGLYHGYTSLNIKTKDPLNNVYINASLSRIDCHFIHGKIRDGICNILLNDSRSGKITIESNSLHGLMLIEGRVHILPIVQIGKNYIANGRSSIFYYENGKNVGDFWVSMLGNGVLTGKLNETGYVTGNRISYIYPDMETSYIGKFENKLMREAYLGDVDKLTFDRKGFPVIGFKMSKEETRPFYYEPPTNESIGAGPYILDPYDQKRVYLSDAGEFGEGVHVKVDMEVGDIACLYSYYIYYRNELEAYHNSCSMNTTLTDDERRHCYKYALGISYTGANLNIPPDKDVPEMFLPTLGQKLNHKFYESHASFVDFESPRWGIVSSIGLYFKDIKKGEQLFVDYGYNTPNKFPSDFLWYWELKKKVDKERLDKTFEENKKKSKKPKKKRSFK